MSMQPVLQICRGAGYVQPNTPEAFQATNDQEIDASEIAASVTRRVDTVSLDETDTVPWRTVLTSLTSALLTQLAHSGGSVDGAAASAVVPCIGASDTAVASCFPQPATAPNPRQLTPIIPVEVTLVQRHAAPVQKMHHIHKSDGHETFEWKDADGAACGVFQPTVVARRRVRNSSDSSSDGGSEESSAEDEDAAARNKLFFRVHELSAEEQAAYVALRRLWAERALENKRTKSVEVPHKR